MDPPGGFERGRKVPYLELPVFITAAQGYERHFEGLPHRVQVVFNHLFE